MEATAFLWGMGAMTLLWGMGAKTLLWWDRNHSPPMAGRETDTGQLTKVHMHRTMLEAFKTLHLINEVEGENLPLKSCPLISAHIIWHP